MNKCKLVLGTAEFNPAGYIDVLPIPVKEIKKILTCAKEYGITLLDTAEAYNCHKIIRQYAKGFCIYTKTRNWKVNLDWGQNELRGILYHYGVDERPVIFPDIHRWVNLGASVYTANQIPEAIRITQIPFNIEDIRFSSVLQTHRTVFVRSVFNRGELLKKYNVKECIQFVASFRPDGIIVGVKTAKELEEVCKAAG